MSEQYWLDFIEYTAFSIYDWVLVFAVVFISLELTNEVLTQRFNGRRFMETLSSIFTQVPFYFSEILVFSGAIYLYFTIHAYIPWKIPVNGYSIVLVCVLADFTYYAEHYVLHRVRLFWLAHSVHHSSQVFNTATAFRFSLFDPVVSVVFHLPLVLMGFNPIIIFAAEVMVQAYQFWIHNEMIGKLGPVEYVLNTPSHHRVHHGSDRKYLDKNFGGVLIIWDRLFGTFQEEESLPKYGLTEPMHSKNPLIVQFHEFKRLFSDIAATKNFADICGFLLNPPGWKPKRKTRGRP
jgi:sterol desaturase/sphingolipid hydroxylase (fatty acid hydroxylase superfamily)